MRILIMSDNPAVHTGMGRVHREIGRALKRAGHDIISIGWFSPSWLPDWTEWRVHRTENNYYGKDVFDQIVWGTRPDVVLTIGDVWMIQYISDPQQCQTRSLFRWVGYVPVDGAAWHGGVPNSWNQILLDMDRVVAYTEYGRDVMTKSLPQLRDAMPVIYHGVDTAIYHPVPPAQVLDWRRTAGIADDQVVFMTVARNQFRKNIPEFCKAWKKFKQATPSPKALFWPHMKFQDPMGWDLYEVFDIYGMRQDLAYYDGVANSPSNVTLADEAALARAYNMCDVFVLLAGEGFGLPIIEAMACAKPVILLEHSASIELGEGRGLLVKVAEYMTGNHSTERPYPHLDSVVTALNKMYRDPKLRLEFGKAGLEFAKKYTWEALGVHWDKLLKEVEDPFLAEQVLAEVVV